MSKLKDKLSANMRMAKENHPQAPAKAAPAQPTTPSTPVPATHPQPPATKIVPGDVPDSGSKLFPDRVWPD